jgi:hypothetical protein
VTKSYSFGKVEVEDCKFNFKPAYDYKNGANIN